MAKNRESRKTAAEPRHTKRQRRVERDEEGEREKNRHDICDDDDGSGGGVPITRRRNSEGVFWYLENDAPYLRRTEGTSDARGKEGRGKESGEERGGGNLDIRKEAYTRGANDASVSRRAVGG